MALLPPKAQGEAEASVRLFSDGALSPNPQLCLSHESFLGSSGPESWATPSGLALSLLLATWLREELLSFQNPALVAYESRLLT